MAQAQSLINTLKRTLKSRGLTYQQVAEGLGISEASVKRLFATKSFSLDRLEKVCELAQVSLIELAKQLDAEIHSLNELTEAQEQELTEDPGLLVVTFLIINGWQYSEILDHYSFTSPELIQHLAKLDRIKLIELLPNNRFHLRISPEFSWRKDGPIQQFFARNMQQEFLNSRFRKDDESLLFLSGMLTSTSRSQLLKRLEKFAREFNELSRNDRQIPWDRRRLCSMIVALRPWRPNVFEKYVR